MPLRAKVKSTLISVNLCTAQLDISKCATGVKLILTGWRSNHFDAGRKKPLIKRLKVIYQMGRSTDKPSLYYFGVVSIKLFLFAL